MASTSRKNFGLLLFMLTLFFAMPSYGWRTSSTIQDVEEEKPLPKSEFQPTTATSQLKELSKGFTDGRFRAVLLILLQ